MFFTHFAGKNELPGFFIIGTLIGNGLMPIHFQIFDQTPAKMKRVNSKNAPAKLSGIYIFIYELLFIKIICIHV